MKPIFILLFIASALVPASAQDAPKSTWQVGAPIVTYWAGPGYPRSLPVTDASIQQVKDGGWNLAWTTEADLDIVRRHGLRALLRDDLFGASIDDPAVRTKLDALIERVKNNPALYAYFLVDEPGASKFSDLAKMAAYLREKDPAHMAYVDLFPVYANNGQLETQGDAVTAYNTYLDRFIKTVKPQLLCYDNYQFAIHSDLPDYFKNLAMVRSKAIESGIPYMTIVQAATWTPDMREPNQDEMRYLIYTTLAYGCQGISYYVYYFPGHTPGIARPDGTTTPVYDWLKVLNREFLAIATQTQKLRSTGAYHAGMVPPGTEAYSARGTFRFIPSIHPTEFKVGERTQGMLLGTFSNGDKGSPDTHAVVVNLDYKKAAQVTLVATSPVDVFDATTNDWSPADETVKLDLPPGGGKLVRLHSAAK